MISLLLPGTSFSNPRLLNRPPRRQRDRKRHEPEPLPWRFQPRRQTFLLERTRPHPMVFTNHETRNTNHGLFRMLRPSGGMKCRSSQSSRPITGRGFFCLPFRPPLHDPGHEMISGSFLGSQTGSSVLGEVKDRQMAEREGFEPSVEFPLHTLSKRAPSTARPSLRAGKLALDAGGRMAAEAAPPIVWIGGKGVNRRCRTLETERRP